MANNLRSFLWARLHRGTNATQNIWATCIHLSIWFQSGMSMRFWLVRAFNYMETALFEYTTIRVWFKMHRESATEFYICRCAQSVCVSCVITFSLSNDIFSWSRARIQACYNYKHKYCFDFNQWHCLVNLSLDLFRFYFIVYCVRRSLIWHCLTNKRNFENTHGHDWTRQQSLWQTLFSLPFGLFVIEPIVRTDLIVMCFHCRYDHGPLNQLGHWSIYMIQFTNNFGICSNSCIGSCCGAVTEFFEFVDKIGGKYIQFAHRFYVGMHAQFSIWQSVEQRTLFENHTHTHTHSIL